MRHALLDLRGVDGRAGKIVEARAGGRLAHHRYRRHHQAEIVDARAGLAVALQLVAVAEGRVRDVVAIGLLVDGQHHRYEIGRIEAVPIGRIEFEDDAAGVDLGMRRRCRRLCESLLG